MVAVDADGPARRIGDVLGEQGVPAAIVESLPLRPPTAGASR